MPLLGRGTETQAVCPILDELLRLPAGEDQVRVVSAPPFGVPVTLVSEEPLTLVLREPGSTH